MYTCVYFFYSHATSPRYVYHVNLRFHVFIIDVFLELEGHVVNGVGNFVLPNMQFHPMFYVNDGFYIF